MRTYDIKVLVTEIILLFFAFIFNVFIIPTFMNHVLFVQIIFWIVYLFIAILIFGLEKNKKLMKYDTTQIILIFTIAYIMIYFLLGLFVGYAKNPYFNTIGVLFTNVSYLLVLVFCEELCRYIVVSNSKKKIFIYILVILFTIIDISAGLTHYDFSIGTEIFKFTGLTLLPILFKNILLTYIVLRAGLFPAITYRLVMELPLYLLPILPDLGQYIESLLLMIFPLILLYKIDSMHRKETIREPVRLYKNKAVFIIPLTVIIICFISLVSGIFKYKIISIVSNSMVPCYSRGDAVIIEKTKDVEIGDIIAYRNDNITVTHRIMDIIEEDNKNYYITKGDANIAEDAKEVSENDVQGKVILKIAYIGYPSIWINDKTK